MRFNKLFIVLIIILIVVGLFFLLTKSQQKPGLLPQLPTTITFPKNYQVGAWVWRSPDSFKPEEIDQIIQFCHKEGINTLYISIDKYIDLYEQTDLKKREQDLNQFNKSTQNLLDQTQKNNINVQALMGNTLWANNSHSYIPKLLTQYVLDYNNQTSHLNKFKGIQYDIEFYNQKDFKKDTNTHNKEYLDLVEQLTNLVKTNKASDFSIGFAIPYWFGQGNTVISQVNWHNTTQPIGHHLLNILNDTPKSYVALMSYRNTTLGDNGSIAISQNLVDFINQNAPQVSVLVGIETSKTEEEQITYFGKSKKDVKQAAQEISLAFENKTPFKGFAIDHLESYQQLKDL